MSKSRVDAIANAVLYEGYMLYPYRPSAIKNRQRFNFGVVVPETKPKAAYSSELACFTTECLVKVTASISDPEIRAEVRFLQLVDRDVKAPVEASVGRSTGSGEFANVKSVSVDGRLITAWQEAIECRVPSAELKVADLIATEWRKEFLMPASVETEAVYDKEGRLAAEVIRRRSEISGYVSATCAQVAPDVIKLVFKITNTSKFVSDERSSLGTSLLSTHTVLRLKNGEFASMTDPPANLSGIAGSCKNVGTWPVLAGEAADATDVLLASPIILSDYPEIAPESPGDLFDGAEIDEILALRIMTLTDDEKREMRSADDRTRAILERTESLPPEQFMKLHGAMRALAPSSKEGG